ncbi:MAG: DUF4105 domain-containing protein [Rhodobacter sp.]|nr:DUF4105 domain-containing protein [Rhodobacter sp.]
MSGLRFGAAPQRNGWFSRALQALVIVPFLALLAMALWFQFSGLPRSALLGGLALASVGLVGLWWRGQGRMVWLCSGVILIAAAAWWSTIRPTNDGNWQPDVARGVTAEIKDNLVTLQNVRDFTWTGDREFTPPPVWETRIYNLDELTEADLFTSVWGDPNIAHVMISFGFADGRHVLFSAETRKQVGQVYSTFGGFFRMFPLVLIAADERDAIHWRTDARQNPPETVSIFPLALDAGQRRALFLQFLDMGNDLAENPRFYNTATTNCTTVPWKLARMVDPRLPLNWRILLSAHLPEYLHGLGVISPGTPLDQVLAQARLHPLGPVSDDSITFSRRLRAGVPGALP